ncbi:hypothetical protein MSG28_008369 [Choristoneura fumiferana]|uniref:Uncharacterized protein n=1 Tax=Choristoneura fumiferana TaxID=7141 RepID=A0ACC0J5K2_CHOFU|nr:hypothetical protein MSG28_008369 [Choristoneura fumiferana]
MFSHSSALCESEGKKRAWRARQLQAARDLAALQDKHKRGKPKKRSRAPPSSRGPPPPPRARPAEASLPPPPPSPQQQPPTPRPRTHASMTPSSQKTTLASLVDRIVQSQSPYLSLQRSGLALCTLRRRAPQPNLKVSSLLGRIVQSQALPRTEPAASGLALCTLRRRAPQPNLKVSSLLGRIVQSQAPPRTEPAASGLALCTLRRRAPQPNLKVSSLLGRIVQSQAPQRAGSLHAAPPRAATQSEGEQSAGSHSAVAGPVLSLQPAGWLSARCAARAAPNLKSQPRTEPAASGLALCTLRRRAPQPNLKVSSLLGRIVQSQAPY